MESQHNRSNKEDLENLFLSFARVLLPEVKGWVEWEDLEVDRDLDEEEEPIRISFNEYGYSFENRRDYLDWLSSHLHLIQEYMEEARACARRHWEAGILPQKTSTGMSSQRQPLDVSMFDEHMVTAVIKDLLIPMAVICEQHSDFAPTDQQIIDLYREFRNRWTSDIITVRMVWPLLNFTSDLQHDILIGDHIHLAPFSLEEKNMIWNAGGPTMTPGPSEAAKMMFELYGTYEQKKGASLGEIIDQECLREQENVVTALRLLRKDSLGTPILFESAPLFSSSLPASFKISPTEYSIHIAPKEPEYVFAETELEEVKSIFNALQKLSEGAQRPHGDLTFALRHFNQFYSRSLPEDQVVDLTIALDSSLLYGYQGNGMTKLLSSRGAALLRETRNPDEVKQFLEDMYNIRSRIVHDGKLLSEPELEKDPTEFPGDCEDIVRAILRKYILQLTDGSGLILRDLNERLAPSPRRQSKTRGKR